jgi:hypothetical protein
MHVTLVPMVKGAEALPREVDLLSADAHQIVVEYQELRNAIMTKCRATIPTSSVAVIQYVGEMKAEDAPLRAPLVSAPPASPSTPPPVTTPAAGTLVPKKRGPKPKPRDAAGNIIRTPNVVAPDAATPMLPVPGVAKPVRRAKAPDEPEFAPEELVAAPSARPVSKYRPATVVTEDGEDLTVDDLDADSGVAGDDEYNF